MENQARPTPRSSRPPTFESEHDLQLSINRRQQQIMEKPFIKTC